MPDHCKARTLLLRCGRSARPSGHIGPFEGEQKATQGSTLVSGRTKYRKYIENTISDTENKKKIGKRKYGKKIRNRKKIRKIQGSPIFFLSFSYFIFFSYFRFPIFSHFPWSEIIFQKSSCAYFGPTQLYSISFLKKKVIPTATA